MKYYVYAYLDGDVPIYIGAGCKDRDVSHLCPRAKGCPHIHNKLRKMQRDGDIPTMRHLLDGLTFQESRDWECFFIRAIGRKDLETGPLLNLTCGGDGVAGRVDSIETTQRKSKSQKAVYTQPETRQRHLEALNRPEVRQRMSESQKATYARPEVRQRYLAAFARSDVRQRRLEACARPEVRQKISVAKRRQPPKGQFKGIRLRGKKYAAIIDRNYLGTFLTSEEAALAYNDAVDKYWDGDGWKNPVGRKICIN